MMLTKSFRKFSPKTFALLAVAITIILCVYYANYTSGVSRTVTQSRDGRDDGPVAEELQQFREDGATKPKSKRKFEGAVCPVLQPSEADINTVDVYKDFDFQPTWMKSKEYWDKSFEDRFERQKMNAERPPLKVIIVPHSHNDPGWLKTFEHYFNYQSRQIINHMLTKLQEHQNLTFIWSEISFLNAWWESTHPSKHRILKSLVKSGRIEITTGGWVMTDEANAHVYAMIDQLIEGHQWLLKNLDIVPTSGWSIDPFGHGSTQPYLLSSAGIKGTVIQRLHYAWKQWFALKQYGDFKWVPNWSPSESTGTLLTHNQPFDIYSIQHSCGPHPYICLNFDFRKVVGEYTDYSVKAQPITDKNVKEKSELLLEQYARTGSLFPHNVVLMPLGDDFRYNVIEEWDQQYLNYMKLINYINSHKDIYKTEISFGTPKDYFDAILTRFDQFPTLKGDFFVYSDIFTEGRPAYWSGYFTTRPFMKILDRELENNLRGAEILYTVALNHARQKNILPYLKILERDFEKLIQARRNLGLFQHHDAITGTSKSFVMRDYGLKLFESLRDTSIIQQNAIQSLLFTNLSIVKPYNQNLILSDLERDSYEKLPKKTPIFVGPNTIRQIILYNSLAQSQDHLAQIRVTATNVKITDSDGRDILFQINPVWNCSDANTKVLISNDEFEILFVASLAPLSITTYNVSYSNSNIQDKLATIYCNKCHRKSPIPSTADNMPQQLPQFLQSKFKIKNTQSGDIQLESHKFKILFNGNSGFMKTVTRKDTKKIMQCALQFAAYKSAQFHSGAYLFKPDPNERDIEKEVLLQYKDQLSIIITSGPISSELTALYGPFLVHTVRIMHTENSSLSDGIYIENQVDFENPPKNRETELFMRIVSDVQNGDPPEFYSDLNGFQMQKRIKIERIGIEGNYFPMTTMAYIQDSSVRLSLLTNHAQGVASWQPGYLEVMLDRRTLYDDSRGMGEGLVDNRKTNNHLWLLIEDIAQNNFSEEKNSKRFENENANSEDIFEKGDVVRNFNVHTVPADNSKPEKFSRPSLFANQMSNALNYPVGIFIVEENELYTEINKKVHLINKEFPSDVHLLTLRSQTDAIYAQFPSSNALLILHRQGYDCAVHSSFTGKVDFQDDTHFVDVQLDSIKATTLTGVIKTGISFTDLTEINIKPMDIKTFNVTFS